VFSTPPPIREALIEHLGAQRGDTTAGKIVVALAYPPVEMFLKRAHAALLISVHMVAFTVPQVVHKEAVH